MQTALSRKSARNAGFALIDLLTLSIMVFFLVTISGRVLSTDRERAYVTIDLANLRQILQASALYASENDGYLAHPTWGGDLSGPDGWAYRTSNHSGAVPGALAATPGSCAGLDVNSKVFTNQLSYFRAGQVCQYLPSVKTTWCPKDVATRGSGSLHKLWISRPMKVSSYVWNASIGGYNGPKAKDLGGRTYKISDFRPSDWQMWEANEASAFNFNDAAGNPSIPGEGLSYRHSGIANWWTLPSPKTVPGGGIIGAFDGSAQLVNFRLMDNLLNGRVSTPNAFLNGPGYQR